MQIPFNSSERASLGVEWELQLVDRQTRELTAGAVEILAELTPEGAEEPAKAKHELLQSTVEVITGICTTVAEAQADLAGTVEAIGDDVTRWRVGEHVFDEGTATFAGHAVAPADQLAPVPPGLGFDEAATLPLAGTTALLCLDAADPAPGQGEQAGEDGADGEAAEARPEPPMWRTAIRTWWSSSQRRS